MTKPKPHYAWSGHDLIHKLKRCKPCAELFSCPDFLYEQKNAKTTRAQETMESFFFSSKARKKEAPFFLPYVKKQQNFARGL